MKHAAVGYSALCFLSLFIMIPGYAQTDTLASDGISESAENTRIMPSDIQTGEGLFLLSAEKLRDYVAMRRPFTAPKMEVAENQAPRKRKMHELTLLGSYMISSGTSRIEDVPPDLFTGRWSPFFGRGYQDFYWSGSNPPGSLDDVIGAAVLRSDNGFLGGFKFAINILPRLQVELVFKAGDFGLSFEDEAWQSAQNALRDAVATLREAGTTPSSRYDSLQHGGETLMAGVNFNFFILKDGPFLPYVSLGLYGFMNGDNPRIHMDLAQFLHPFGQAKYLLMITYDETGSACPNIGVGAKLCWSQSSGIKVEARALYSSMAVEQLVQTNFDSDSWIWIDYSDYFASAATQKISRFIIDLGIGFFFSW